jgi:hypothetical protein
MPRIEVISAISWFLILLFAQPIFFLLSFSNDLMDVFCLLTKKQRSRMTRYRPLFRSCKTLRQLIQFHAHLLVTNLFNATQASIKLIECYAQMGSIESSTLVFETYQNPDSLMRVFLENAMFGLKLFRSHFTLLQDAIQ